MAKVIYACAECGSERVREFAELALDGSIARHGDEESPRLREGLRCLDCGAEEEW